jgi:GNAT superfamily N-acetyltransferase
MRRRLGELTAVHSASASYSPAQQSLHAQLSGMDIRTSEDALDVERHPLLCTHPETGRCSLFFNGTYVRGLEGPGIDYASANYRWFCERYERFLYVDRIVVDPPAQGLGVGRSLYEAFAVRADGQSHLCAEVNVRPRNDRSLAFHEAFGFRAVGEQETGSEGKRVRMFALEL